MYNFISRKIVKIILLMVMDICAVTLASLISLAIRFDLFLIPNTYMNMAVISLPVYAIVSVIVLSVFKLYNRVWSYASIDELISVIKASILMELVFVSYHIFRGLNMPKSYYPLHFVFIFLFLMTIRFIKVFYNNIKIYVFSDNIKNRIMIVGAGAAASILIKEVKSSPNGRKIICAIDDNINKLNSYILGVKILGNRYDIERLAKELQVSEIIIAMPSASNENIKELINICNNTGKSVKILPSVAKSLTSSVSKSVRPINYEDLLGRDAISINQEGIGSFIREKVVLVTGGGGSIGSELCRQIIKYKPEKLIILDIYENNAYEIEMELKRRFPDLNVITLIGSIRDFARMEIIFKRYRPEIVYHAAAHKHVPLMEHSPNEAIKNNCFGTLNLVKLSDMYDVEHFILISTDKAVRPTNIMGATKRICEMIVQTYANRSKNTRFAAVRFGNVLGSNGSVIPLFLKQIEEGGPVTVTHKDITRFFMTIPEAVSLVLQASLFAKGGEIFVLDMGKPVKIYELAENIIKLKGFKVGEDINIEIVGLRPGEKLYEEILMDEEGLDKTENNMIFIGKPLKMDEEKFLFNLDELIKSAMLNKSDIKERTEEICDTYTITFN